MPEKNKLVIYIIVVIGALILAIVSYKSLQKSFQTAPKIETIPLPVVPE